MDLTKRATGTRIGNVGKRPLPPNVVSAAFEPPPEGVSFTFDSGKEKNRTMMGVTVAQAYELARAEGASFVGANCGVGIESYIQVAQEFARCGKDLPIWIKGNAGIPEVGPDGRTVYKATPETFAKAAPLLVEAGARFIGGCCGSTPAHVRALAGALSKLGGFHS